MAICGNKVTSVKRVACAPLSMTESGERAEFISRSAKRRVSCGNKGILPQLRPHTEHTHRRQRTRTLLGTSMASSRAKAADQISPTTHPPRRLLLARLRPASKVHALASCVRRAANAKPLPYSDHSRSRSAAPADRIPPPRPPGMSHVMNVPRPSTFIHGQHEAQARGCRAIP